MSGFASELEATNQKTEARCNGIRKEVSKALSEQRQQLITQSEAMAKKMDGVAAKVQCPNIPSVRMTVCLLHTIFRWHRMLHTKTDPKISRTHMLAAKLCCLLSCLSACLFQCVAVCACLSLRYVICLPCLRSACVN